MEKLNAGHVGALEPKEFKKADARIRYLTQFVICKNCGKMHHIDVNDYFCKSGALEVK